MKAIHLQRKISKFTKMLQTLAGREQLAAMWSKLTTADRRIVNKLGDTTFTRSHDPEDIRVEVKFLRRGYYAHHNGGPKCYSIGGKKVRSQKQATALSDEAAAAKWPKAW